MSNEIRYDSLLVQYLAVELSERLTGRGVEGLRLDPDRRMAALDLGDEALLWRLHPTEGWVTVGVAPELPESIPVGKRCRIAAVVAPPDERLLSFELEAARRRPGQARRVIVELMGNQWNVVAVDDEGRIVGVLWRRSAGGRELRPGRPYAAPPASGRAGIAEPVSEATWYALLADVPPAERERRVIGALASTSPINAAAILGEAAQEMGSPALSAAYARYHALASLPPASPRLLDPSGRRQPYPLPLPGVEDRPFPTLLDAMRAAVEAAVPEAAATVSPELLDRLRARLAHLEKRRARLTAELEGAGSEATALRHQGDLLLSQLHRVRKGMQRVVLQDFTGGTVEVELDPALSPTENAHTLYESARKRERAAERIPELLDRASAEYERLAGLLARAESGEAGVDEVREAIGGGEEREARGRAEAPTLPYRRYRTSGGLEVRVGRNRHANDELTLRHASPNDIWLHARDVGGAHVVLRWGDAAANPPARDLSEAAVLAALHSKARTSGTVAVDWTRRKYVRKPRKAPPGLVAIERARTLFVEPDAALERRLRVDES